MFNVDWEKIFENISAVLFSGSGGIAYLLYSKDKKKMTLKYILPELFVSGFTGMMALKLCRVSGLEGEWLGLVCGIAGWTSPAILFFITRVVETLFNLKDEEKLGRK